MKVGLIIDICVLKPVRVQGIGARLILLGVEKLGFKGMTAAMLEVDDLNMTKTMKLYEVWIQGN